METTYNQVIFILISESQTVKKVIFYRLNLMKKQFYLFKLEILHCSYKV